MRPPLPLLLGACLAPLASAQTVEHYWDFSSVNDSVGGVPTVPVGLPDLSVHPTYGEAYPGAGASLNSVLSGTDWLEAQVLSGPTLAMDWGTDSYSVSYWSYDDFAGDGDMRGPRVFDALDGTNVGFQLGTNQNNDWNFRNDDDLGAVCIFNQVSPFQLPQNQWFHITAVVDRSVPEVRAYLNGVLQATVPLVDNSTQQPFAGNIIPGQDLQIGIINNGGGPAGAQSCGLDDLAFYRGALTASDAMALASGAVTPSSFQTIGSRYCAPAAQNSTGLPAEMSVSGSPVRADNDVTLVASQLPPNSFGFFLTSETQGFVAMPGGSQGNLCLSGNIGRFVGNGQIQNSGAAGSFSLAINLGNHPTPFGPTNVVAGETWNYQGWYRDPAGPCATGHNLSNAMSVTFY